METLHHAQVCNLVQITKLSSLYWWKIFKSDVQQQMIDWLFQILFLSDATYLLHILFRDTVLYTSVVELFYNRNIDFCYKWGVLHFFFYCIQSF